MEIGMLEIDDKVRSQCSTLILAAPGGGKSVGMEAFMRYDLHSRQPFCCLDRHGPIYDNLIAWCAYNGYYDRRIKFIDLSDSDYVIPLNFFQEQEGIEVGAQTSCMVDSIMGVFGDQNPNAYPVMFKLLKVVFTVMIVLKIRLDQAFILLAKREFNNLVDKLPDPYIKALWSDLSKLQNQHHEWSRQVTPTLNRIFRVIQSKAIRRFLCLPHEAPSLKLTFEDTIFVKLATSGTLDNDSANTFLALFLSAFYLQAKRRRIKAEKPPSPYFLYVDEWVQAPTPDYERIAGECRKYGLLLTLANQDLSQIRHKFGPSMADTILTLCQIHLCFGGINDVDAERLAREWGIDKSIIRYMDERKCVLKLPRQVARVFDFPEIHQPFLQEGKLADYDRRIAAANDAITVDLVDRYLAKQHKEDIPTDDTQDGWAIK